ncbi:auxin efflux carrier [Suillus clintonianus]|uniref:auxin efflux carrier n=1 Tax=Suillus clintonianus TaxID=1904413 RepID=UPI001B883EDD|nr:auxin efflux carrier [Suillus clintonianus]KAG2122900.1 auxin efflux carrier [Suillus clintonianus]
MADMSFGILLWVAARPILRLFICVACGYGITRAGWFDAKATRCAVQVVLNITLPSLMFSRTASVLNAGNDAAFGPLLAIAVIYMAMGFALSLVIKQFFSVPSQFRYGIIVAGSWASSCDITISVMTDIMASLPFDGTHDQNLAVAYIGAFCVIFYMTLFTLGRNLIERDFIGTDGEVQGPCRAKRWELLMVFVRRAKGVSSSEGDEEAGETYDPAASTMDAYAMTIKDLPPELLSLEHSQTVSATSSTIVQHSMPPGRCDETLSSKDAESQTQHNMPSGQRDETLSSRDAEPQTILASTENSSASKPHPVMRYVKFLSCLISPVLMSVVVSIIVSRISALQALFIPVSGTNIPPAPDGQPPLAFIMDSATFLGAANSPIGLIILGSVLARMSVPCGRWTALPLGAIGALAVGKQLIMPVFGVFICEGFTRIGFIDADDKVLRFVCIFVSCLPITATQLILTQARSDSDTGTTAHCSNSGISTTEHLVAFLLPQYILMFGVMPVLMTFTFKILFD